MFLSVLNFEFKYQSKQFTLLAFSLLFFAFGVLQGSQGYASLLVDFNSPYQISFNVGIATLGCEFVIMFFAVSGMLRDQKHRMESIIYSTPIGKVQFFWSRFFGVFMFSLLSFSMVLVGFIVGTLLPSMDPTRLAPFDFGAYVWTWAIFILPNIFICSAVIFSVAALTKNNIATYISAILIYALYMIGSLYFNSPILAQATPSSSENMVYAALIDPFGLAAFFEQTQYWTPFEKNKDYISFSGFFMWNRVIWVLFSSAILGTTYYFFSFRKLNQRTKRTENSERLEIEKRSYYPVKNIILTSKFQWQSFKTLLKIELVSIFKSLPFLAIMLVWVVIVFINIYEKINSGGAYNDSLYPSTNILIALSRDPILSLLLIVFYSGELVWKVREIKFNGIIDSTPASNSAFFLSKMTTLILLPIILISTSIIICIGFQISKGYFDFEMTQYLGSFYYSGIGFFFYILLTLFVQSLVSNKYLGMSITGILIALLTTPLAGYIGIEHPMLRLGRLPYVNYTNMNGYGNVANSFHYYVVYWNALGLILVLCSFKLWRRGEIQTFGFRINQFLSSWKKWEKISLVFLCFTFIASGGLIFYNVNILDKYQTSDERLDFKSEYEKKYKQYESLDKLAFVDMKTEVDIFPKEGRYDYVAKCVLENVSKRPIKKVFITERMSLDSIFLENAKLIEFDSIFKTHLFELKTPLYPEEKLKFTFRLSKENIGFKNNKELVSNGSCIFQHSILPTLGYRKSLEIKNDFERENRGLDKLIVEKISDNHIHSHQHHNAVPINFETIISTHKDQTALASGNLIDKWQANDRNYFHYKSPQRIVGSISYFSAEYDIMKEEYKGISIEQYYHSDHDFNIEVAQESTKLALDYCIQNFGPYPFDHIRIAEIPGHFPFGGQAMPGVISMVEDRFYLIDNTDPEGFDLVAKRTIHEVAHQWWGMILSPKIVEGGSILIEGLAKYTEAVVMEKMYGKSAVWQISESANKRYFSGRSYASEEEPPLCFTDGEGYLSYGKNFTVMLALKELIGEEKVNEVLRKLIECHRDEKSPSATSLEFIDKLYNISPPEYHKLIDDWMKKVITYDLKLLKTEVNKQENGKYKINLTISAKRFEMQDNGESKEIAIDEPIQIGAFTKHPSRINSELDILHLEPVRINKDQMDFEIIIDEFPKYLSVDPFGTRSDKNRLDNIRKVEK